MSGQEKKQEVLIRSSAAEYLTYAAAVGDNSDSIEMRYEDENIWLTQKMLAVLYDVDIRTINYHLKKIFADSELEENSVIRNFRITATDGKSYNAIAADYDRNTALTKLFYATVQNKLRYAVRWNEVIKSEAAI